MTPEPLYYVIFDSNGYISQFGFNYIELNENTIITDSLKDRELHYVLNNQITDRPENPTTLINHTLTNIPLGSEVYLDHELVVASTTSPTLELEKDSTSSEEKFLVKVTNFPMQDFEVEL